MTSAWRIIKAAIAGYIANGALSRGAAISFYAVTSLAPVLLIAIAVAGLAFGQDAVRGSLVHELAGLLGRESADLVQSMIAHSSDPASGATATIFGVVVVIVTASGVFGEMQAGLNATWKASPPDQPLLLLIRARAASLGLVAALGFLLMVSLAASAALTAFKTYLGGGNSFAPLLLSVLNAFMSLALFTVLFGAIYKVLPDIAIAWRDVITGALVTAVMFTAGKSLIGWYLGAAAVGSTYGAAGALIVILLWAYYSAQIFLLGAEITKAVADNRNEQRKAEPVLNDSERVRG
jgi:membrane protein